RCRCNCNPEMWPCSAVSHRIAPHQTARPPGGACSTSATTPNPMAVIAERLTTRSFMPGSKSNMPSTASTTRIFNEAITMTTSVLPQSEISIARPQRGHFYYGWINLLLAALAMTSTLPGRTHGLGLITKDLTTDPQLNIGEALFGDLNFWAI